MERNDTVIYEGRPCVVEGFDPMSVEPRRVYLRDRKSGEQLTCLYQDLIARIQGVKPENHREAESD